MEINKKDVCWFSIVLPDQPFLSEVSGNIGEKHVQRLAFMGFIWLEGELRLFLLYLLAMRIVLSPFQRLRLRELRNPRQVTPLGLTHFTTLQRACFLLSTV